MNNPTTMERTSERELVIKRTVNGPAHLVFQAWSKAELMQQWWVPKSFGLSLLSCEMDVRAGGTYRLVFPHGDSEMPFFGRYLDVIPNTRIVWTNDDAGEAGSITTVSFEEKGGKTQVVLHELYPTKEALEAALESGEKSGMDETFGQLEEVVVALGASAAGT